SEYGGIAGTSSGQIRVCCADFCTDGTDDTDGVCTEDAECANRGSAEDCCPDTVAASKKECAGEFDAPCIPGTPALTPAPSPAPTPSPAEDIDVDSGEDDGDEDSKSTETPAPAPAELLSTSDSDGTSSAVIALSVLLATLVLGNIACFAWSIMRRRKEPPTPPPAGRRDANTEVELGRLRRDLETEHTRRVKAETLVHRAKGGGLRSGDFPSVRDVYQHVYQLADDALAWTEKACAVGGSHPALNGTILSVLYNTFLVCRRSWATTSPSCCRRATR
ncbi:unnamed protein product, partial [Ectocarpus sp. 12 AP-2014]